MYSVICAVTTAASPETRSVFWRIYQPVADIPPFFVAFATESLGQLVPLGSMDHSNYTCGLSTSSSATALLLKSYLGAGFVLRCFQHLSCPDAATRLCSSAEQPVHRRSVQHGPLVLVSVLLKSLRPQQIETELSHDVLNPARVPL